MSQRPFAFLSVLTVGGDNGAYFLLTTPEADSTQDGWEDQIAAKELKQHLLYLIPKRTGQSDRDFDKSFDARCNLKRNSAKGFMCNHCKVYCVDRRTL